MLMLLQPRETSDGTAAADNVAEMVHVLGKRKTVMVGTLGTDSKKPRNKVELRTFEEDYAFGFLDDD